jgi:hypothetical protein
MQYCLPKGPVRFIIIIYKYNRIYYVICNGLTRIYGHQFQNYHTNNNTTDRVIKHPPIRRVPITIRHIVIHNNAAYDHSKKYNNND